MHILCCFSRANQSLSMILANEEAQTRPYQYYVTVLSLSPPY